jgi:hypothetical protein
MVFTKNPSFINKKIITKKDGTEKVLSYDWRKYAKKEVKKHAPYLCECGCSVSFYHKQRHFRSQRHLQNIKKTQIKL